MNKLLVAVALGAGALIAAPSAVAEDSAPPPPTGTNITGGITIPGLLTSGPDGYQLTMGGWTDLQEGWPTAYTSITGPDGFSYQVTNDYSGEFGSADYWKSLDVPSSMLSITSQGEWYYLPGMSTDHTVIKLGSTAIDCTNGMCNTMTPATSVTPATNAPGDPTFTLEPLDFDHVAGFVLNDTQNQLGGSLCPCIKVPYPSDGLQDQEGVAALAKAIDSGQIKAGDTVLGFSLGGVTAGAYLNSHTPTPGIRFVLLGTDTSKYGQATVQGSSFLWGGTLQSAPAGTPVTVLMNQYDEFAAYPSNIFAPGYMLAVQNASSNNQHDYANPNILDNPNNITWKQDGITYELVPASSLPMNNWLRSIGLPTVADSLDSWERPLIDQAYGSLTPEMVLASARAKTAATAAEQVTGIQPPQRPEPVLGGGTDVPIGVSPSTTNAPTVVALTPSKGTSVGEVNRLSTSVTPTATAPKPAPTAITSSLSTAKLSAPVDPKVASSPVTTAPLKVSPTLGSPSTVSTSSNGSASEVKPKSSVAPKQPTAGTSAKAAHPEGTTHENTHRH